MSGSTIAASSSLGLTLASAGQSPVLVLAGAGISLEGTAGAAPQAALYGGTPGGWSVLNQGSLEASLTLATGAAAGAGLWLQGAGQVSNATGGLISGNLLGAALAGGQLENAGTILGGVSTSGASLARGGVEMAAGTLLNDASGLIAGGAYGASFSGTGLVQNAGRIAGFDAAGLVLGAGGSLSNEAGGQIYGGVSGVVARGAVSILNDGTLRTGSAMELAQGGLALSAGGYVDNRGFIYGEDGVLAAASAVTLVNAGLIEGGGGLALAFPSAGYTFAAGAGVAMADGTVRNSGTLLGGGETQGTPAVAGAGGAGLSLGAGLLLNSGDLLGGAAAGLQGGAGLQAGGGVSAVNDGLVAGGAGAQGGIGAILSGSYLRNQALISGGAGSQAGGDGVVLLSNATLVNDGTVSGGDGVSFAWGAGLAVGAAMYGGTLLNDGVIEGGSPQHIGIVEGDGLLLNAGSVGGQLAALVVGGTLENGGVLAGSAVGVDLLGGTLVNAGTLAGGYAAYLGPAATLLAVAAGAVFAGKVRQTGGDGTLALLGGTGTLDMGSSFTGFTSIDFADGASWTLAGGTLQLAGGESLAGFAGADVLVLEGFSASSWQFVQGEGLVLANAQGSETIELAGSLAGDAFTLSASAAGTDIAICYRRGTRVMTLCGEREVEALRIGDMLPTYFGGQQAIKWLGRQVYPHAVLMGRRDLWPVRIGPGALGDGRPARPLHVSPGHSVLVDGTLLLARSLVNGVNVTQPRPAGAVEYFLMEFDTHDCVLAEGLWAESFADGPGLRAAFHNAAEHAALFPRAMAPQSIQLCAPRPEQGAALEAALAPLVAKASALVAPGRLRGELDRVQGRKVEGWAQDLAWPELPQLLEFHAGARLLGTALACHYRPDLEAAGIGAGRAAFSFAAAQSFDVEMLRIVRAVDGATLHLGAKAVRRLPA